MTNQTEIIREALELSVAQLDWYARHAEWKEEAVYASQKCTEALSALSGITEPEGWKLVPIEATEEMWNAAYRIKTGYDEFLDESYGEFKWMLRDFWKEMISASPSPPKGARDD